MVTSEKKTPAFLDPNDEFSELYFLARSYVNIQSKRVALKSSFLRFLARYLGYEKPSDVEPHFAAIVRGEEQVPPGLEQLYESYQLMLDKESAVEKELVSLFKKHPLWEGFVRHIPGAGAKLTGVLVGYLYPLSRFSTPAKVWKYVGYAPGQHRYSKNPDYQKYHGTVKKIGYNIGVSFLRRKDKSPYSYLYYAKREYYEKNRPDWTKAHIHLSALRYMNKIFLAHLWTMWWRLVENRKEPHSPYAIERLKHRDYIDPEYFVFGFPQTPYAVAPPVKVDNVQDYITWVAENTKNPSR